MRFVKSAVVRAVVAILAAVACAGAAGLAVAGAVPQRPVGSDDPLDIAFRFASAIQSDPKDMGRMQQAVALDYAYNGDLDAAVERSERIAGWRRGVVQAELARQMAVRGRVEDARALIDKAEAFRKGIEGWENPRIASHVAMALAAIGEAEKSLDIATKLAGNDPLQYSGRSQVIAASIHAGEGEFDEAMKRLDVMAGEKDFEPAWWRTQGYLEIARRSGFTPEQRRRALTAAREAAGAIEGWRRADALLETGEELRLQGREEGAREAFDAAETIVDRMPETATAKVRLLGDLARSWSRMGEEERSLGLLDRAMVLVPDKLDIDRPGLYAELGSSYMVVGQEERAWSLYDQAFDSAEALSNSRPRAIAVVSICRSMGRNGVELKGEVRSRLDSLYSGLKDPW